MDAFSTLADRVTVLRDGLNACESRPIKGLERQDLVRLMIGRNEQIPFVRLLNEQLPRKKA